MSLSTDKVAQVKAIDASLKQFNTSYGRSYTLTTPWTPTVAFDFTNYLANNFFPALSETKFHRNQLGDAFRFVTTNDDNIGAYAQEYAFLDMIPQDLDSSKVTNIFVDNYKKTMVNVIGSGTYRRMSFTVNPMYTRRVFSTLGEVLAYVVEQYTHCISMINLDEERRKLGTLVNYANTAITKEDQVIEAKDLNDMVSKINLTMMNMQSQTDVYNEATQMLGATASRYTIKTDKSDLMILTTNKVKNYITNSLYPNTWDKEGIDISNMFMTFPKLGMAWKSTEEFQLTEEMIPQLRALGDDQSESGDLVLKDTMITIDPQKFAPTLADKFTLIEPDTEDWALLIDAKAIKFSEFTDGMARPPFVNEGVQTSKYYLHYYTRKYISPFYNKAIIKIPKLSTGRKSAK